MTSVVPYILFYTSEMLLVLIIHVQLTSYRTRFLLAKTLA